MYQIITRIELIECLISTQKIHEYPEIKQRTIDRIGKLTNEQLASEYFKAMKTFMLPITSNLFMFKN